jgi:hypothetical protein
MLTLAAQNRIDFFATMYDDLWKMNYKEWGRASDGQKTALRMATSATKLMGLLTNAEFGIVVPLVEGDSPELAPSGETVKATLTTSDRRPPEVRELALTEAKTLMTDIIDAGIQTWVQMTLSSDPLAAAAVDMSEMPKHALTRFIAQMQPKSVDEATQPMPMNLVASTLIAEAKKKARADESRLNKKANNDLTDKESFKPQNNRNEGKTTYKIRCLIPLSEVSDIE